jgi:predicted Rdx family selenoprotein
MKNNSKYLIVILIILAISSYFVLQNKQDPVNGEGKLLIPELQNKINDVDAIIISKNEKQLHLTKSSGTWHLQEAKGYLADTNKIASLLLNLRKFNMTDKKTSNPENYKNLGLAEKGADAATVVKLAHGDKQFADISLGKEAQKSQGTYVRKNSEKQTWLTTGHINVSLDSSEWIVTTILDITSNNIKSVTFSPENHASFEINKLTPKDQEFVLKGGIPENMKLKSSIKLNELANGLQKLKIDSIADVDLSNKTANVQIDYKTFTGMVYHLEIFKLTDKFVLNIQLKNSDSASDFDKQLQNWHYYIPNYKFDALNKKLDDLIEPDVEQSKESEKKN